MCIHVTITLRKSFQNSFMPTAKLGYNKYIMGAKRIPPTQVYIRPWHVLHNAFRGYWELYLKGIREVRVCLSLFVAVCESENKRMREKKTENCILYSCKSIWFVAKVLCGNWKWRNAMWQGLSNGWTIHQRQIMCTCRRMHTLVINTCVSQKTRIQI